MAEEEKLNEQIVKKTIDSEELEAIIKSKDKKKLRDLFVTIPAIDLAEAANELPDEDLIYIFRTVESSYTADFFAELSGDAKESLIKAMTDKELVSVINGQSADDVTDAVVDLPANLASRVMRAADPDMRKDINTLLNYKEDTAGALMTTEYLEFLGDTTVEDTIEAIRAKGKDAETIYTIFVKDKQRHFLGTVDLDDLIFASKEQKLSDIMNKDVVSCLTSTDQEEVGQMFARYDLNAMAVLNEDKRLVGHHHRRRGRRIDRGIQRGRR